MTKRLYQKFKEFTSLIIEEVNKRNKKKNYFWFEEYEVYIPDLKGMHYKDGKVEYFLESLKQTNSIQIMRNIKEMQKKRMKIEISLF